MVIKKIGRTIYFLQYLPLISFYFFLLVFLPAKLAVGVSIKRPIGIPIVQYKHAEEVAFYISALIALIQTFYYLLWKKVPLDYIALGCDLFLISGALGFLTFKHLLELYAFFKDSTAFFYIVLVGTVTTLIKREGFIQVLDAPRSSIVLSSLVLLGWSLVPLAFSFMGCRSWVQLGSYVSLTSPFIYTVYFARKIEGKV